MSKACTALAKPMEPLFSVEPPRWPPGTLLKLAGVWFARQKTLEYMKAYGLFVPEKDGVML
jgi:hypothetical protein